MRLNLGKIFEGILLEGKCRKILKEELSVSEDVIKATYELVKEINNQLDNSKWQEYEGTKRMGFFFIPKFTNSVFNLDVVNGFIIDTGTYENYTKRYNEIQRAAYYARTNTMFINVPYFDGKIYYDGLIPMIAHELEHKYQDALSNGLQYGKMVVSGERIMANFKEWSDEYCLGYALYYLSKNEIDANCHRLAMELKKKKIKDMDGYKKTRSVWEKDNVRKMVENVKANPAIIENCKEYFECTPNVIIKYLGTQLGYLERKFRKVVALCFNNGYDAYVCENVDMIGPMSRLLKKKNKA